MLLIARRILAALIALAMVGGTTGQLARAAQYAASMTMPGVPCDMTQPAVHEGQGTPMVPCKGLTPGCIKQMGCVAEIGLPTPLLRGESVVAFAVVDYWSVRSDLDGVVPQPEPLPPRTA